MLIILRIGQRSIPTHHKFIYEGLPETRGPPISTTVYSDYNHAHDQVTQLSVSVVMCFVGSTSVSWSSKIQGDIKTYSYSTEFCTGWVAIEEAVAMRYILRSLGVPVKGPTSLCGDNLGMIIYCTNQVLELKNEHVAIQYHKLRESAAERIVNPIKVWTTVN